MYVRNKRTNNVDLVGTLDSMNCRQILSAAVSSITNYYWVAEAAGHLREHGGEGLIAWLQEQRSLYRCRKRIALIQLLNYLEPRSAFLDYPRYRERGWQIGTGMMESTAKQLVGLRLKGPGMHWTEAGALAITALRAQDLNNRWHSFWKSLALPA